jgi:hypothetical protein
VPRRGVVITAALTLPAGLLACSGIFGFQQLTLLDAGLDASVEGGADAQVDSSLEAAAEAATPDTGIDAAPEAAMEAGCVHAVPPGLPTTDDTPDAGDGGVDIVFALDTLDLGQNAAGQFNPNDPLGFDLDGVCTCFDDGGPSCANAMVTCDTAGGRDEAANQILAVLGAEDSHLSQASLQAQIASGAFGILLHVHGYNGLANDQSVVVEYFPSPGSQGPPSTDGGTAWNVTPESVLTGGPGQWVSIYQDLHAYVNDHVLVSHLAAFAFLVLPDTGGNDNPITFDLRDVVAEATMVSSGGGGGGTWSLQNGQMGARWATSDALYSFHTLSDTSGNSLCGSDLTYQVVSGGICSQADIASSPANDNQGLPCDALSIGLGFTASPAQLGDELDPLVVPSTCPDNWAPMCP